MKKIIILLVALSVLLLCGCNGIDTLNPNPSEFEQQPTEGSPNNDKTNETEPGTTLDWELPIDVDDSFTEPATEPTSVENTTSPDATEPNTDGNGEQVTTAPSVTQDPTEPTTEGANVEETTSNPIEEPVVTTEPETTVPQPTFNQSSSGPIELPLIPG